MKKYIILASIIFSFGCSSNAANNNILEIKGGIHMKGFSRNIYLGIEDSKTGTIYRIQNPKKFNLNNRQNETVKIKAKLLKKVVGPGFPAVIEVLEVKN
ncbi:MAG: hypothetical protein HF962_07125 [Sulfurovum sp.]|nr:hypothetical protein [Sulfurovum sp.]